MSTGARAWLSYSEPEPELARMVLVSTLLHLAALAIVLLIPREIFSRTPPPVVAYTVKIVDPSALGGRLPQGPLRPEKEPEAPPVGTRDEKPPKPEAKIPPPAPEPPEPEEKTVTIPEVKKEPEKKPEPVKQAKVTPKPAEKKPAEKKPSKQELARIERDREIQDAIKRLGKRGQGKEASGLGGREPGKGAALGVGGDGGGGGILTGLDFIIYKNQVEGTIKRNWTWAGANPNLTVRVGFRIDGDGRIQDVRIIQPSSDSSYDQSVLRAIRASTPLPAPPENYREVFADYVLDFVSGEMRAGG